MADETQDTQAPEAQPETQEAPSPKPQRAPKAAPVEEAAPEAPRQHDPMMAQLVAAQRELESTRKELESHRAKAKQYERDTRKQSLLGALYDEFPGLPRNEIRGAALVAAEDGAVDLYSEDHQAAVDKLKELLRPKSKVKAPSSNPAPSLGGTPGTAAKPPTPHTNKLPI